MLILFDHGTSRSIARFLHGHVVVEAVANGWDFALNNMTLPFVLALADKGYRVALAQDLHLRAGLNVHEGHVTCKAVADALKLPYMPAEQALRM